MNRYARDAIVIVALIIAFVVLAIFGTPGSAGIPLLIGICYGFFIMADDDKS